MPRFPFAVALFFTALLIPAEAQVYTIQPRPVRVENKPRGGFSLSFHSGGALSVGFQGVGNIASLHNPTDATSEMLRTYDDGFVALDTRGGNASPDVGDDGRTNTWGYRFNEQATADGNLAFHQFSTSNNGTQVTAETGSVPGVDMQYDMCLGVFGSKVTEKAWAFSWGGMVGGAFSAVNAKKNERITANLRTLTDFYSPEGAVIPLAQAAGYQSPSTTIVPGFDANGNPIEITVDNSTLINNRPYSRTDVTLANGAQVDGFWQVKGAYYSFRAGPWLRWQFSRHLSLRASAGATYSFLGVTMEYDELLVEDRAKNVRFGQFVRVGTASRPEKIDRVGLFGALDAEWWLSDRTGIFASVTYEDSGSDVTLRAGESGTASERTAIVKLPSGTGFRAGFNILF